MAKVTEEQIREEYLKWFKKVAPSNSIAVTTTFNRNSSGNAISEKSAGDAVRAFSRLLNSRAFGYGFKKHGKKLTFMPVNEGGRGVGEKHPHCHFLIELPCGWTKEAWCKAVEEIVVRKIKCFSSTQFNIKPVWDHLWLEYILKRRDKKSFADAIDVVNLWVNK